MLTWMRLCTGDCTRGALQAKSDARRERRRGAARGPAGGRRRADRLRRVRDEAPGREALDACCVRLHEYRVHLRGPRVLLRVPVARCSAQSGPHGRLFGSERSTEMRCADSISIHATDTWINGASRSARGGGGASAVGHPRALAQGPDSFRMRTL